jgi:hypothetical protein
METLDIPASWSPQSINVRLLTLPALAVSQANGVPIIIPANAQGRGRTGQLSDTDKEACLCTARNTPDQQQWLSMNEPSDHLNI